MFGRMSKDKGLPQGALCLCGWMWSVTEAGLHELRVRGSMGSPVRMVRVEPVYEIALNSIGILVRSRYGVDELLFVV